MCVCACMCVCVCVCLCVCVCVQLGVSGVESSSSGPGASVFVGVLLTGLLVAAGLIGGYCFKNRRTPGDKGTRLVRPRRRTPQLQAPVVDGRFPPLTNHTFDV